MGGHKKAESKHAKAESRRQHRRNKQGGQGGQGGQGKGGATSGRDGEEGDFTDLRRQLEAIGLTLRKVTGDGNCLFRAFSDQLYGTSDRHFDLRCQVVSYMRQHKPDFEPFLILDEETSSYERHLALLAKDGTYGGNESIVAFAKLRGVTIVIHQLNEPLWRVEPESDSDPIQKPQAGMEPPELHISYHNGDHYNSVRKKGHDNDRGPANIKIQTCAAKTKESAKQQQDGAAAGGAAAAYTQDLSDYENFDTNQDELQEVMRLSGTHDALAASEALELNAGCVQVAAEYLMELRQIVGEDPDTASGAAGGAAPLWKDGGTGNRLFGDEVSRKAIQGEKSKDKMSHLKQKLGNPHLSNKKRKDLKKQERKLASEERKRNRRESDDDSDDGGPIVASMDQLEI